MKYEYVFFRENDMEVGAIRKTSDEYIEFKEGDMIFVDARKITKEVYMSGYVDLVAKKIVAHGGDGSIGWVEVKIKIK